MKDFSRLPNDPLQQIDKKLNNSEASSMADWSRLPYLVLEQISQKLNSELYLVRFRSVCSSWRRSSIPNCYHNHLPLKLPRFPDQIDFSRSHDRRLFKQNIFLIKPPEFPDQQRYHLRPWLIRIGTDVRGKAQIWHPFDDKLQCPLYFARCLFMKQLIDVLQLPVIHLGHLFYIYRPRLHCGKIVTTTCEVGRPLAVMTYNYDVPYIFQCEENSWRSIPTIPYETSCGDICIFKGRPCVADKHGHTFMIGDNSNVCLIANPVFGGNVKFLVESECELLLVDCYGIDIGAADKDIRFDVFRLDEKEKNWVKLTTLGDRVLFVNRNCSFSASASDLHVANGNCIIYTSRSDFQNVDTLESRMRIFHLDNGRVSRLSRYPNYIKLFWPPPKWILELHNKGSITSATLCDDDGGGGGGGDGDDDEDNVDDDDDDDGDD